MFLAQGVVPRSWTLQDTKFGFWRQFGSGVLTEACTYIFGDGSGTHSAPRIRRVGWSAVIIQGMSNCLGQTLDIWKRHSERLMNSLKLAGGWMGTLGEGERNTVGRAELMACVVAAESTRGNVVYVTDYQILKKRQDRGWPTPRLGGDCPVPSKRGKEHLRCSGSVRILTLLTSIKTENHDMAIVFGNEMADAVAKKAASEAAVRRAAAEQIAWVDAMAWQVQRRIIEANLQASKANPTVLTLREKGLRRVQYKTVLQALFEQTTHQLAFRRSRQRWECQTCKQSMGETSLVRWLRAGPCSGEIQTMQSIGNSLGMNVQQVRAGAYIPIGWKIVHPSHSVAQYRGITWCWNCAAWTSRSLCKLSAQCSGVIKSSARDALSRIKRGYPPRAKMSWPLPATATEELQEWPLTAPVNVAP